MEKNFKYIYLFKCGKKFYKIGISGNPESRRQSIESSNPWLVHIITMRKVINALQVEANLHNKFRNKKRNGEWFELTNNEAVKVCVMIHKAKAPKIAEQYSVHKLSSSLLGLEKELREFRKETISSQKLIMDTIQKKQILKKEKQDLVSIVKGRIETDKELIEKAILLAKETGFLSASFLQRKLSIGYARAARIMDKLEAQGIVSPLQGAKEKGFGGDMQVKNVSIGSVHLYPENPREIEKGQFEKLKKSIREFGFVEPLVINDRKHPSFTDEQRKPTIIGGNMRWRAAKEEGHKEVPTVWISLDKSKEAILNIALNRISGKWDIEKLGKMVFTLSDDDLKLDLELTGLEDWEQKLYNPAEDVDAEEIEKIIGTGEKPTFVLKVVFANEKDYTKASRIISGNKRFRRIVRGEKLMGILEAFEKENPV